MKICEMFRSLQGEGTMIGVPTGFIRTTGCNLDCTWCDTRFAIKEGREMSLESILEKVDEMEARFVCVTGGEPLDAEGHDQALGGLAGVEATTSPSRPTVPCHWRTCPAPR